MPNKNVEHKSSQCDFNKHFIQGFKEKKKKRKEKLLPWPVQTKSVLWHKRIKEANAIAWGIYRTFKILIQYKSGL